MSVAKGERAYTTIPIGELGIPSALPPIKQVRAKLVVGSATTSESIVFYVFLPPVFHCYLPAAVSG